MNYLVFELCDNDYGHSIKQAVELALEEGLDENAGHDCVWWKDAVIKFTLAIMACNWYREDSYCEKYLREGLHVYVSDKFPTYDGIQPRDDDGGSVILDLHTGFVTTF